MTKYITVTLCLFVILACKQNQTKKEVLTDTTSVKTVDTSRNIGAGININPVEISSSALPSGLRFKGKVFKAFSWQDKLGSNVLITSIVAAYADTPKDGSEDAQTSELHAFHFVKADTSYKLLWKISDAVKQCEFDITASFVKDGITITDLDNDGIAETVVQYIASCRSDVSPDEMKLIMHEDSSKYVLRGLTCDPGTPNKEPCVTAANVNLEKAPAAKEEWEEFNRQFGRYRNEKDFANAPPSFLEHARNQWLKHLYPPIAAQ